jgi:hypothetical protein
LTLSVDVLDAVQVPLTILPPPPFALATLGSEVWSQCPGRRARESIARWSYDLAATAAAQR